MISAHLPQMVPPNQLEIANNLAEDRFNSAIIELPQGVSHKAFRCQDFVLIVSENQTDRKVKTIALWTLIGRCKLWESELITNYDWIAKSMLSESGLVLVEDRGRHPKFIMYEGKQTGELPEHRWISGSIHCIGTRILSCWATLKDPNHFKKKEKSLKSKVKKLEKLKSTNSRLNFFSKETIEWLAEDKEELWTYKNSDHYFGEWNQQGECLSRHKLNYQTDCWSHLYAYNEKFWVRLSSSLQPGPNSSLQPGPASIIEVVDRLQNTMQTYVLPFNPSEERFSSACIVQNQLFYGKSLISEKKRGVETHNKPTIGIFDLINGTTTAEFQTGAEKGSPQNLVANQHYVAWSEKRGTVKYLNILTGAIKNAVIIPDNDRLKNPNLNLYETVLSVIYPKFDYPHHASWFRKVINLTNGEQLNAVKYMSNKYSGNFTMSNGNILISDGYVGPYKIFQLYLERYFGPDLSRNNLGFRDEIAAVNPESP